jgi:hypothetical protein
VPDEPTLDDYAMMRHAVTALLRADRSMSHEGMADAVVDRIIRPSLDLLREQRHLDQLEHTNRFSSVRDAAGWIRAGIARADQDEQPGLTWFGHIGLADVRHFLTVLDGIDQPQELDPRWVKQRALSSIVDALAEYDIFVTPDAVRGLLKRLARPGEVQALYAEEYDHLREPEPSSGSPGNGPDQPSSLVQGTGETELCAAPQSSGPVPSDLPASPNPGSTAPCTGEDCECGAEARREQEALTQIVAALQHMGLPATWHMASAAVGGALDYADHEKAHERMGEAFKDAATWTEEA